MKNISKKNIFIKHIYTLELFIISLGSILSLSGTLKVCKYNMSYLKYIFFPFIAMVMIILILIAAKKRWMYIHIIALIFIYIWGGFAGLAYISCQVMSVRYKNEIPYRNSEMSIIIDDNMYQWDGETIIYRLPEEYNINSKYKIQRKENNNILIIESQIYFSKLDSSFIYAEVVNGSYFKFNLKNSHK